MISRRCVAQAAIALGIALCATGCRDAQEASAYFEVLWDDRVQYIAPNDPVAIDINADGANEIVITDSQGYVTVWNAAEGKPLWSRNLGAALTAPAVGHFWGDGSLDVAVADKGGRIYLLNGGDGRELVRIALGTSITLAPTVLPPDPASGPENDDYHPALKDFLLVLDSRTIYCLIFGAGPNQTGKVWQQDLQGTPEAPASVGDIDGRTGPQGQRDLEVVVGVQQGSSGLLHALRGNSGNPLPGSPEDYNSNIVTIPSLADVPHTARQEGRESRRPADGRDEVFFVTRQGYLYINYYDPARGEFWPHYWPVGVHGPFGDPILVPREAPRSWILIVRTFDRPEMRLTYGGEQLHKIAQSKITSSLALISQGADAANARLIYGDQRGWIKDRPVTGDEERGQVRYEKRTLGGTPIVADFDGKAGAEALFLFPNQRRMQLVRVPASAAAPGDIVWQTRGGNLWRTGWRDPRYARALGQRYQFVAARIADALTSAATALDARQWKEALAASEVVLDINPAHGDARKIHRKAWVRDHILALAVGAVIGLVVLVIVGYAAFLVAVRAVGLKQAAELVDAGRLDEATTLYTRLHQRFPKHAATNASLAELLITQDRLDPEYAPVLERAYADRPGDSRVLGALADCYRRSGALSPRARDVYLKALETTDSPAELKFLIGRSFAAERKFREAARYLGEALAEGYRDETVYEGLADAYFELQLHDLEVLPILERVRPARSDDTRFLAYLCDVYSTNDRTDDAALECAQQALEHDPECDPARILYIEILLHHGQIEGAWRRAETLLNEKPDQPEVLRIVSRCLIALDRRDDEAVQILEKALTHYPNDPQVMAHLSHVYFMRNWFDPHAADIHRRAYELVPEDNRVVEAMACLAERDGDDELAASYLEKLLTLGRRNRELMLRLARAYRALGVEDPKARQPYEVAVEEHPDDLEYLKALGNVYIAQKETAPAAVAVLGRLHEEGVELPGLNRQLIAALDRNNESEPLIGLCDQYLDAHPGDAEVKRIRANAYLATGQIDRAVAEYEQLMERGPENEQVIVDLARAYAEAQRTDERAIAVYKSALRTESKHDALYRALGCAHAERGDLPEAIAQFRAALRARKECAPDLVEQCMHLLESDPARTPLRWFLCEVLINCGRFREAIEQLGVLHNREPESRARILEALGHILDVDPDNVHARRVRGKFLLRAGRLDPARTDLEEADRLQPENEDTVGELRAVYEAMLAETEDAELRFRLGQIYHAAGDLDNALKCFQKSVRDYRFENDSTHEMGRIFMAKNLLDLALEEFQKLRVQDDDDLKETLYQLGQMYEDRADAGGARAAYRLIFAADAGFRDVQQRFEALSGEPVGQTTSLDRTMILSQLSEKAKHRYKLLEEIGRGAMGIVYRAMDSELDEVVALKILPDNLSTNKDALARFRREARSARRLSHRNIVRIHDIGEEMGRKYISMEFVEGTTLKALIRAAGGLEPVRVLKYGAQVLDALAYAHSIGIVHRDIKPANIIISRDDEVKITDFGIAKILESTEATAEGAVVGTPLYMSPEQVRGDPVDHRADLYSVGILFYECIEGKPPFVKGDLAYSHLHLWPEPMVRGYSEVNQIVMRALEKRKEDRWPSAQAMLDAIKTLEPAEEQ